MENINCHMEKSIINSKKRKEKKKKQTKKAGSDGAHEVKGKKWQREDQRKDLPQFDNSYVMSLRSQLFICFITHFFSDCIRINFFIYYCLCSVSHSIYITLFLLMFPLELKVLKLCLDH